MAALSVAVLAATAHANHEDDQNDENLGVVERALDKYQKDTAIFDGTSLAADVDLAKAKVNAQVCDSAMKTYDDYFKRVTAKGKGSDRAKKLTERHDALAPWCAALRTAVDAATAAAKQEKEDKAHAAAEQTKTCRALEHDAQQAVPKLDQVLDMWAGNRWVGQAADVKVLRGQLDLLEAVCDEPAYASSVSRCDGVGTISGDSNARYDDGDICAPFVDLAKTWADVLSRGMAGATIGMDEPVTVEQFRSHDGWIQDDGPVDYPGYFTVSDKYKKDATDRMAAMYAEAGVDMPTDQTPLWAKRQAYLDSLKAAVDATAAEWTFDEAKCKGYMCKLAEKAAKRGHKKAKIKKTYADGWDVTTNDVGVPTYRSMGVFVLFKAEGPYCELRHFVVWENYKGGGKFQKAKAVTSNSVRLQKC